MGLKGYRLWVMGQFDSTCSAPPLSHDLRLSVDDASSPTWIQLEDGDRSASAADITASTAAAAAAASDSLSAAACARAWACA
jgi:hypothetical protein